MMASSIDIRSVLLLYAFRAATLIAFDCGLDVAIFVSDEGGLHVGAFDW